MKKVKPLFETVKASYSTIKEVLRQRKNLRLKKNLQKKNKKNLDVFDSCENLPAWRFFKILESGELRYLLDSKKLPEYFESLLVPIWDNILSEYDKLNHTEVFSNSFKDFNYDLIEHNELAIMKACLGLLLIGSERAFKELEQVGISLKRDFTEENIRKLRRKIAKKETYMKIMALKQDKSKSDKPNFIKGVVQVSNILKRHIDKNTVTVAEWIYLQKECSDIIAAKKSTHGGSN